MLIYIYISIHILIYIYTYINFYTYLYIYIYTEVSIHPGGPTASLAATWPLASFRANDFRGAVASQRSSNEAESRACEAWVNLGIGLTVGIFDEDFMGMSWNFHEIQDGDFHEITNSWDFHGTCLFNFIIMGVFYRGIMGICAMASWQIPEKNGG
jgi:hypothetical protein